MSDILHISFGEDHPRKLKINSFLHLKNVLNLVIPDYPVLLEFEDSQWTYADEMIYWGYDIDTDKYLFSGKIIEGVKRRGGYFITNVDLGTTATVTMIFEENKEISYA